MTTAIPARTKSPVSTSARGSRESRPPKQARPRFQERTVKKPAAASAATAVQAGISESFASERPRGKATARAPATTATRGAAAMIDFMLPLRRPDRPGAIGTAGRRPRCRSPGRRLDEAQIPADRGIHLPQESSRGKGP